MHNKQLLTVVLVFCCHAVLAQQDWEARAEANAQRLTAKNGTGTDLPAKRELLKMRDDEHSVRNILNGAPEAQKPCSHQGNGIHGRPANRSSQGNCR